MKIQQRCYSKDELAQRGQEIYVSQIQPIVASEYDGKILAIDVDSGAFEIDDDTLVASDRLLERYPEAQTWFLRIGHRGVHQLGWHRKAELN